MKKYRLGYDYILLTDRPFEYKGDLILSLSIDVMFKILDKKGVEVFFESEELNEQPFNFGNGNSYHLNELINYSFNTKDGLDYLPNFQLIPQLNGYGFIVEIKRYNKDVNGELPEDLPEEFKNIPFAEPMEITREEFMEILNENIQLFNIADNATLQSTAYFTEEIIEK